MIKTSNCDPTGRNSRLSLSNLAFIYFYAGIGSTVASTMKSRLTFVALLALLLIGCFLAQVYDQVSLINYQPQQVLKY